MGMHVPATTHIRPWHLDAMNKALAAWHHSIRLPNSNRFYLLDGGCLGLQVGNAGS